MTRALAALVAGLLALLAAGQAGAHRLDEYLQATMVSVEKTQVSASMRMIPGVATAPAIIAAIDSNGDGVLSPDEQRAYASAVLNDLLITLDGQRVHPVLAALAFPLLPELRDGLGEIRLSLTIALPAGAGTRKLVVENHHRAQGSVYLMNAVVPRDPAIHITAQQRKPDQSAYELDFDTGLAAPLDQPLPHAGWLGSAGFVNLFQLGMRHIAEGTDHLLFLLALLLPAPLVLAGARWGGAAPVRTGLRRIVGIVTAFTVGHSVTLALAASGVVTLPAAPVEVLIAVSILVSAAHALRPLFARREAAVAAFFGLIHGLAFAATLDQLGLGRWERVAGVLAFNLGIETMQLAVVLLALPPLLLLSRTGWYAVIRIAGALFAAIAAAGWIAERLFDAPNPVDGVVSQAAANAIWIALALWVLGLICRLASPSRRLLHSECLTNRSLRRS
jgi:hypothetical protein